ncbi:winged helix-turn-helix domain-containing protein [Clostridium sp. Marseille-P2415]|uniref:winged helix-turn-helix domain-containing protein n=1 Tax=Clostridium sp. Marseille-P2415 TaxID=1805471 RepID=UPI000988564B|nr:LysR family transcriptional regulator [Clostridium sp. Marseille-P2415]
MKDERKLNYHIRIRVFYEERNFGPGVAGLMKLVRERGSLAAACQEMHMAYSKAWKIINKAEADLGFSLMEGRRGGENGGTTVLTAEGEDFLDRYLAFTEQMEAFAEKIFHKYFPK